MENKVIIPTSNYLKTFFNETRRMSSLDFDINLILEICFLILNSTLDDDIILHRVQMASLNVTSEEDNLVIRTAIFNLTMSLKQLLLKSDGLCDNQGLIYVYKGMLGDDVILEKPIQSPTITWIDDDNINVKTFMDNWISQTYR